MQKNDFFIEKQNNCVKVLRFFKVALRQKFLLADFYGVLCPNSQRSLQYSINGTWYTIHNSTNEVIKLK